MNESRDQGMKESAIKYQIINHVAYEPDVMILMISGYGTHMITILRYLDHAVDQGLPKS